MKTSRIVVVFILALVLNFVWECLHSFLYLNYRGGPITFFILFRASVFDAILTTVLYLLFLKVSFLKKRLWLVLLISFFVAIAIEAYALQTGRWMYNNLMPIVPLINLGLTPLIQLPILTYLTFKIAYLCKLEK